MAEFAGEIGTLVLEKEVHKLVVTILDGSPEDSVSTGVKRANVGLFVVLEKASNIRVVLHAGEQERRGTVTVLGVDHGLKIAEGHGGVKVAVKHGMMKGGSTVFVLLIDRARALVHEKVDHGLLLAKHGSQMQGRVAVPVGTIDIQALDGTKKLANEQMTIHDSIKKGRKASLVSRVNNLKKKKKSFF